MLIEHSPRIYIAGNSYMYDDIFFLTIRLLRLLNYLSMVVHLLMYKKVIVFILYMCIMAMYHYGVQVYITVCLIHRQIML